MSTATCRRLSALLAVAVALVASGCAPQAGEAPGTTTQSSRPRTDLPVVSMQFDEDGPHDVDGAINASDHVVLAQVVGETGGARFYGNDGEDTGEEEWMEDVDLLLKVDEYLKGFGDGRFTIRWPKYVTSARSSDARIGILEIEGAQPNLDREATYLFFLKDHGEPWRLTSTSMGAAFMEVGPEMRVGAHVAPSFRNLQGQPLTRVLPPRISAEIEG